ncbi:LytR C-terminal domain-containing protein [Haliangium ochraceum]|nr:LytR C-terminal domain-containing protein [Haliangium ochraceum]
MSQRFPSQLALLTALIAALAVLIVPAWMAQAQAQPEDTRVVVLPFNGSGGGSLARETAQLLAGAGYQLVPSDDYRNAARKLDARGSEPENIARVAAELKLDIVLLGDVRKGRGGRQIEVQVHLGSSGEQVAVAQFGSQRRKLNRKEEAAAREQLLPTLAAVVDSASEPEEQPEEAPAPAGDSIAQADDTEDAFDPGPGPGVARSKSSRTSVTEEASTRPAVEVAVGVSVLQRSLSSDVNGAGPEPSYNGSDSFPASPRVEVLAFPMALATDRSEPTLLHNIGLRAYFERTILFSSALNVDGSSTTYDTVQMRVGAGLLYRLFLGSSVTAPELQLGVDYDNFSFTLDRPSDDGSFSYLPDHGYASLAPALGLRVPINTALSVSAHGRLLVLLGIGDAGEPDRFGSTSSALGFDAGLDVSYGFTEALSARLGFRFTSLSVGFEGDGELAQMQGVEGMSDTYLGGVAMLGYAF